MPSTTTRLRLLFGLLALSLACRLMLGFGVVSGISMWPALAPGDVVLYARGLPAVVGSIVVVQLPGHGPIIKRVAALSERGCFLLGDNLGHSYDSREYGFFDRSLVIGRVLAIWPQAGRGQADRPARATGSPIRR